MITTILFRNIHQTFIKTHIPITVIYYLLFFFHISILIHYPKLHHSQGQVQFQRMKSMPEAAAVKSQITGEHMFLFFFFHMFLTSIPSLESVVEGLKPPTGNLGLGNCVTKILNIKCYDEINNLMKFLFTNNREGTRLKTIQMENGKTSRMNGDVLNILNSLALLFPFFPLFPKQNSEV